MPSHAACCVKPDAADAEHFAGEQRLGFDARDHDLGDARRFLLEHAAQDVLAVDDDRHEQQHADDDAGEQRRPVPEPDRPRSRDALGLETERRRREVASTMSGANALALEPRDHHVLAHDRTQLVDVGDRSTRCVRRSAPTCRRACCRSARGSRRGGSAARPRPSTRCSVAAKIGRRRDDDARRDRCPSAPRRASCRSSAPFAIRSPRPVPVASMIVMWRTRSTRCCATPMYDREQHDAGDQRRHEQRHHDEPARANALEVLALRDDEDLLIHGRTSPSRRRSRRRAGGRFDGATAASARIARSPRRPP